ncbi:MAG: sel1 repeat family protein [Variovorax sp.]|nr:sel1 repeat family protein [Variovorax sp.]
MPAGIMAGRARIERDTHQPISIQAVIAMTGSSQRTWWPRIEDGTIRKLESDARGRAMVALRDVLKLADCGVPPDDLVLLLKADAGDAEAQADIGEMFISTGRPAAGRYWLELAAEQGHPNAMQCLAHCYLSGAGVPTDEDMALRWLADAAVRGHVIASAQMRALRAALLLKLVG